MRRCCWGGGGLSVASRSGCRTKWWHSGRRWWSTTPGGWRSVAFASGDEHLAACEWPEDGQAQIGTDEAWAHSYRHAFDRVWQEPCNDPYRLEGGRPHTLDQAEVGQWKLVIEVVPVPLFHRPQVWHQDEEQTVGSQYPPALGEGVEQGELV